MLPIAQRLKRNHLFTKAYGARKVVSTPLFTLYVLPRISKVRAIQKHNEELVLSKSASVVESKTYLPMTGFVVSKKVSKSAVLRNRMKRRLREAYRSLEKPASANQWYVMVLVIKENVLNATWTELCRTIENAFGEAARKYGQRA